MATSNEFNSAKAAQKWKQLTGMAEDTFDILSSGTATKQDLQDAVQLLRQQSQVASNIFSYGIKAIQATTDDLSALIQQRQEDLRGQKLTERQVQQITEKTFGILFQEYQDKLLQSIDKQINGVTKQYKALVKETNTKVEEVTTNVEELQSEVPKMFGKIFGAIDQLNKKIEEWEENHPFSDRKADEGNNQNRTNTLLALAAVSSLGGKSPSNKESSHDEKQTSIFARWYFLGQLMKAGFGALGSDRGEGLLSRGLKGSMMWATATALSGSEKWDSKVNSQYVRDAVEKANQEFVKEHGDGRNLISEKSKQEYEQKRQEVEAKARKEAIENIKQLKENNPREYRKLRKAYIKDLSKSWGRNISRYTSNILDRLKVGFDFFGSLLKWTLGFTFLWPIIKEQILPLITKFAPEVFGQMHKLLTDTFIPAVGNLTQKIIDNFPEILSTGADIVVEVFKLVGKLGLAVMRPIWEQVKKFLFGDDKKAEQVDKKRTEATNTPTTEAEKDRQEAQQATDNKTLLEGATQFAVAQGWLNKGESFSAKHLPALKKAIPEVTDENGDAIYQFNATDKNTVATITTLAKQVKAEKSSQKSSKSGTPRTPTEAEAKATDNTDTSPGGGGTVGSGGASGSSGSSVGMGTPGEDTVTTKASDPNGSAFSKSLEKNVEVPANGVSPSSGTVGSGGASGSSGSSVGMGTPGGRIPAVNGRAQSKGGSNSNPTSPNTKGEFFNSSATRAESALGIIGLGMLDDY